MHYPVQGDPYVTFWLKKVPLYLPPKKNRPAAPTLSRPTPPRQGRPILVVPHCISLAPGFSDSTGKANRLFIFCSSKEVLW